MDVLQQIIQPISKDLELCRTMLGADMKHANPLLGTALRLINTRSGKMMRPMLTLLSACLSGTVNDATLHAAVAYEAFHTASLIHDDVVDDSTQRRGQESINSMSGSKVAVLVGDYILALALQHISATNNPELVNILSDAAKGLSHGELLQLANTQTSALSEETYFDIIRNKTAALFAACAQSGAITVNADSQTVDCMYRFGMLAGMCFQIKDDIFDYFDNNIGKPTGNDMAEGKLTLPAIHALQTGIDAPKNLVDKIKARTATHDEIQQLVDYTKQNGGISYAETVMNRYADEAKMLLSEYPDTSVKAAMMAYIDYVLRRNY